jgi:hypothetical protein
MLEGTSRWELERALKVRKIGSQPPRASQANAAAAILTVE